MGQRVVSRDLNRYWNCSGQDHFQVTSWPEGHKLSDLCMVDMECAGPLTTVAMIEEGANLFDLLLFYPPMGSTRGTLKTVMFNKYCRRRTIGKIFWVGMDRIISQGYDFG